jgi:hypothetical protein
MWSCDEAYIPVRKYACDFCTDHSARWTSDNNGSLVCRQCGVVPVAISRIDGSDDAVVNTNTFNRKDDLMREPSPTDFDGELLGDRLARRKKHWIADVSVVSTVDIVDC